jgi:RNA polymerase sigma factor (sigma-70 family)
VISLRRGKPARAGDVTAFSPHFHLHFFGHGGGARGLLGAVSSGPSDADLVLLLRRQRPGAFDEVFRRYKDRIWRFLWQLCRHGDLAADLFQETWLAAARNAHKLREDTQLAPWLFTIARNKHRNGLRFAAYDQRKRAAAGQAVQMTGQMTVSAVHESAPEQQAELRQMAGRVSEAFAKLADVHREVLLLAVQEGLDARAIAGVLGLREEAARKRLSRARAELARAAGLDMQRSEGESQRSEKKAAG